MQSNICTLFDGVMIGRAAYHNPMLLIDVDRDILKSTNIQTKQRIDIAKQLDKQAYRFFGAKESVWPMARHVLGLYCNRQGAKRFRSYISHYGPKARPEDRLFICAARYAESLYQDTMEDQDIIEAKSSNDSKDFVLNT